GLRLELDFTPDFRAGVPRLRGHAVRLGAGRPGQGGHRGQAQHGPGHGTSPHFLSLSLGSSFFSSLAWSSAFGAAADTGASPRPPFDNFGNDSVPVTGATGFSRTGNFFSDTNSPIATSTGIRATFFSLLTHA